MSTKKIILTHIFAPIYKLYTGCVVRYPKKESTTSHPNFLPLQQPETHPGLRRRRGRMRERMRVVHKMMVRVGLI